MSDTNEFHRKGSNTLDVEYRADSIDIRNKVNVIVYSLHTIASYCLFNSNLCMRDDRRVFGPLSQLVLDKSEPQVCRLIAIQW